jgi:hypothetical protein
MSRNKKPPPNLADYAVGDDNADSDLSDGIFETTTKKKSKARNKKRSGQTPAEKAELTSIDSSARHKKRYIICLFIPSFQPKVMIRILYVYIIKPAPILF